MRALNKLTALQLIRNTKHIEYRNGLITLDEVNESETKLAQYKHIRMSHYVRFPFEITPDLKKSNKINKTMRALNKLTALQLIRNIKNIEYRNGLTTLDEVNESETKLSQYLNTI